MGPELLRNSRILLHRNKAMEAEMDGLRSAQFSTDTFHCDVSNRFLTLRPTRLRVRIPTRVSTRQSLDTPVNCRMDCTLPRVGLRQTFHLYATVVSSPFLPGFGTPVPGSSSPSLLVGNVGLSCQRRPLAPVNIDRRLLIFLSIPHCEALLFFDESFLLVISPISCLISAGNPSKTRPNHSA